jgi:hypothetical protein
MPSEALHQLPDPPDMGPTEVMASPPIEDASPVVLALELGWRIAALYADLEQPLDEVREVEAAPACLPPLKRMPNGDQLELRVRAAASLARRLKVGSHSREILAIGSDVKATCESRNHVLAMRERLCACHTSLVKELWADHESRGKAYELGTSLFDSFNRVRLAASGTAQDKVAEWRRVFGKSRTKRIKWLLDDLQSQLPATAVTVVKAHLDFWHEAVAKQVNDATEPPKNGVAVVKAQTIIWWQLLTEHKEPEAFLKRDERRRMHREFTQLVWRSFLRPLPIVAGLAAVAVLAGLMSGVIHVASPGQSFVALLGAIGLSQASLAVIARDRIREWTGLLWNRALANVVFDATCLADEVFEWKQTSVSRSFADAGRRLTRRPSRSLPSRPTSQL